MSKFQKVNAAEGAEPEVAAAEVKVSTRVLESRAVVNEDGGQKIYEPGDEMASDHEAFASLEEQGAFVPTTPLPAPDRKKG